MNTATEVNTKFRSVDRAMLAAGLYRATFSDGRTFEFNFERFFPGFAGMDEVQRGVIINGARQKLDDCQADAEGDVEYALGKLQTLCDALNAGKWTSREGGDNSGGSLVVRAMMVSGSISFHDAQARWDALVKRNMEGNPKLTERQIGNAIRGYMLAHDPAFNKAYNEIKAAKEAKAAKKVAGVVVELDI